jgi:hypothetical protein
MAVQIYTALKAGEIPELPSENTKTASTKTENVEKIRSRICVGVGVGFCGGVCILCLLTVPILSIVFSRGFPWQEDGSLCDPKKLELVTSSSGSSSIQQVKCTCREDFPTYMLTAGVLEIISLFCLMISALGFFVKGSGSSSTIGAIVGCLGIGVITMSFVITVLMLESMLSSDIKCGESLWQYGICVFVFSILSFLSVCGSLIGGK